MDKLTDPGSGPESAKDGAGSSRGITAEGLELLLGKLIGRMAVCPSDDVLSRLSEMKENETERGAAAVYECMFRNLDISRRTLRPFCQDTGILHFYIRAGAAFRLLPDVERVVRDAALAASANVPLRPNAVLPFTDRNTGNNIGPCAPYIHWEITGGDSAEITVYMAGGGSSLPGFARVLTPSQGYGAVEDLVAEAVRTKGVNSCPPLIAGVGIGPSMEIAAELSKKALLRRCGSKNPDPDARAMEERLFRRLNAMRLGPGGTGGSESMLAVNVEAGAHHPATLAMAVSFGCWATRKGVLFIDGEGNATVTSHRDLSGNDG